MASQTKDHHSTARVEGDLSSHAYELAPGRRKSTFAGRWFNEAVERKAAEEPNQMSVASVDERGRPSLRMVLLKGYGERGFIFYTNYDSRKGRQLQQNGHAALCLYWEPLQRQVPSPSPTCNDLHSVANFTIALRSGILKSIRYPSPHPPPPPPHPPTHTFPHQSWKSQEVHRPLSRLPKVGTWA